MAEAIAQTVTLRGGPCDGVQVTVTKGQTLLMQDGDSDDVARYRPARERGVYSFRGMDRVVARLPQPGSEADRG